MAIDRLLNIEERKQVAWFGIEPPEDARKAFLERGFQVASCADADLQNVGFLSVTAAVVFTQKPTKIGRITAELKQHARRLLDYDCRVIIRPVVELKLNGLPVITSVMDKLRLPVANLGAEEAKKITHWQPSTGEPPLPHARVYSVADRWAEIANFLLEHQPGPAPNASLAIEPGEIRESLPSAYKTLLQRAFWDCTEVYLKRMDDGHSGVSVYLAYPELAKGELGQGEHGQWPLPCFLKIGDRAKIFHEFVNYLDRVDPYIPFHLGPHLIGERCCLGARAGVIVGDFVEESESLVECARSGRAGPAIACLFNRTLVGWYRTARQDRLESSQLGKRFLDYFPRFKGDAESRRLFDLRIWRARELGATRSLAELRELFQCCVSMPVLVGAIHGDLHAGNVRVRSTDAIVIDFTAHDSGPLVYDAACLEASLLVDGFEHGKPLVRKTASREELDRLDSTMESWLRTIETLYDHVLLQASPIHPNPKNSSCWFHGCVRQIRHHAWEMESGQHQYAACLALALLRKATKDLRVPEPEASRRAAAYVLAERVLVNAFGSGVDEYVI